MHCQLLISFVQTSYQKTQHNYREWRLLVAFSGQTVVIFAIQCTLWISYELLVILFGAMHCIEMVHPSYLIHLISHFLSHCASQTPKQWFTADKSMHLWPENCTTVLAIGIIIIFINTIIAIIHKIGNNHHRQHFKHEDGVKQATSKLNCSRVNSWSEPL